MSQPGGGLHLAAKPLGQSRPIRQTAVEDLEGHHAIHEAGDRLEDDPHPSGAQDLQDAVARVAEQRCGAVRQVRGTASLGGRGIGILLPARVGAQEGRQRGFRQGVQHLAARGTVLQVALNGSRLGGRELAAVEGLELSQGGMGGGRGGMGQRSGGRGTDPTQPVEIGGG
jgi:hypothetical protein